MKELSLYCLVFNHIHINNFILFLSLINVCSCAMHTSIYCIMIYIDASIIIIIVCATLAQCMHDVWVSGMNKLSSLALHVLKYAFCD